MGLKRVVDVSFWTDGKVDEFSPEDKYFMLYLLTNPFSTLLGIYEISIKQAAFQLGYSPEVVYALIDRFQNKYNMIRYSKETNEIAILNFLRHSIVRGGKPVADCIKRDIGNVKNKALIEDVFRHISEKGGLNPTIEAIIAEYCAAYGMEMDNGKWSMGMVWDGNGNGVSYPVTGNDTSHDTSRRHYYGEESNVLLSEEEVRKLAEEYPDIYKNKIERLSKHMLKTGKEYDNHYETIRQWAEEDKAKEAGKRIGNSNPFLRMAAGR